MSVLDKLIKNSTVDRSSILKDSRFFEKKDYIQTQVPIVNVAFSGQLDGGIVAGLTTIAGPSKHFKTGFLMLAVKSFFDKYPDGACLFYDSEFGAPQTYFENFGIDMEKVWHTPVMDIEQLKFDAMKQLTGLEEGDHVIIVVDSIGALASKKEVEDALEEKSVADMSRAKALNSFFRMTKPYLNVINIPMIVINHTYLTMEKYARQVVSGGTKSYLLSDNIFIIGRQQEVEGTGKDKS